MSLTLPMVYLVRHSDTAWTLTGQHTGRTDLPLTESGERAACELGSRLASLRVDRLISSPLQRARRSAELAMPGALVETDDDLMEWDYGAYEGRRTADIEVERPGWRLFGDGCPGGETLAEVSTRADRVIARARAMGGDVLLFAHHDILRVLAARWIALPALGARCLYLETSSLSVLGYDHGLDEPVIRMLNDTRHS